MILKERDIPINILKLEALLRRLPQNHSKRFRIEEDLAIAKAGFRGEQSIDYYLKMFPLPEHIYLHDLRLSIREQVFQIDTLLVAPGYLLIIELKNIAGTLHFDEAFQQMTRFLDEQEERFPNPIFQTSRQRKLLEEWLTHFKVPTIPVYSIVVFTNNKTIIKSSAKHRHLIQIEQLPHFLTTIERQNPSKILSGNDQQTLSSQLIKQHTVLESDILSRYQLTENDLMKGIQCSNCSLFAMKRVFRKWQCSKCLSQSNDAHQTALKDYFLLLRSTITNKQLREFASISSCHLASKLLRSFKFSSTGSKKGRVYHVNTPLRISDFN